jgi:hypothetical protein
MRLIVEGINKWISTFCTCADVFNILAEEKTKFEDGTCDNDNALIILKLTVLYTESRIRISIRLPDSVIGWFFSCVHLSLLCGTIKFIISPVPEPNESGV